MLDLSVLDYVYIGVVLGSTIWATIRGGVYETVATLSWIVAGITARFLSPILDTTFQGWFKLQESTIGTLVSAYFIVFFVILLGFGLFNQKIRDKIQESMIKVTDHTLGVIFGVVRGIFLMGLIYWGILWYYSDTSSLPEYVSTARTRPVMQLTAVKVHNWFTPGKTNNLLERDMTGLKESIKIYNNLISPAIKSSSDTENINLEEDIKKEDDFDTKFDLKKEIKETEFKKVSKVEKIRKKKEVLNNSVKSSDIGYKNSERQALENQLLQIDKASKAESIINKSK